MLEPDWDRSLVISADSEQVAAVRRGNTMGLGGLFTWGIKTSATRVLPYNIIGLGGHTFVYGHSIYFFPSDVSTHIYSSAQLSYNLHSL